MSIISRLILAFHTLVLFALVVVCIASPLVASSYPDAFNTYVLWFFGAIGVLILGSWYVYAGQCPLTVWENGFRKSEGRKTYAEPCMDRYAREWFGVRLPWRFSDIFPIAILLIPVVTRFFI
ncbi:MAG: DUF2784 family protein [Patescibacteria group bacterium]